MVAGLVTVLRGLEHCGVVSGLVTLQHGCGARDTGIHSLQLPSDLCSMGADLVTPQHGCIQQCPANQSIVRSAGYGSHCTLPACLFVEGTDGWLIGGCLVSWLCAASPICLFLRLRGACTGHRYVCSVLNILPGVASVASQPRSSSTGDERDTWELALLADSTRPVRTSASAGAPTAQTCQCPSLNTDVAVKMCPLLEACNCACGALFLERGRGTCL